MYSREGSENDVVRDTYEIYNDHAVYTTCRTQSDHYTLCKLILNNPMPRITHLLLHMSHSRFYEYGYVYSLLLEFQKSMLRNVSNNQYLDSGRLYYKVDSRAVVGRYSPTTVLFFLTFLTFASLLVSKRVSHVFGFSPNFTTSLSSHFLMLLAHDY